MVLTAMAFLRDLRYSARSLGRSPGLAAALIATIAVGIGTHATVAGFINGLLTRNLGVPHGAHLAAIHWRDADARYSPVPFKAYLALQGTAPSFDALAAVRESRAPVTLRDRTGWMSVAAATDRLWDVLPVPAALGRTTFDDAVGDDASIGVVIAHKVWRNEFNGQADAIGAAVVVDGRRAHVVGVAPEWFEGIYLGRAIDLWVPIGDAAAPGDSAGPVWVLGRLRTGATVDDAQRDAAQATGAEPGPVVMRYSGIEPEIQIKFTRVRSLLAWATALVFLTAGANVAGLLLSRASRRSHETAARVALGATRGRLAAQIVADSVVLTIAGGVLGGLVAFWTASAFPALFYAEDAERLHLMPDAWQIAGSAGAFSALMLLCALAPLAQIHQQGPMAVLRRTEGTAATAVGWFRSTLVIAQMGVCVVLVIGTALLFEGFRQALRTVRAETLGQPVVAVLEAAARYAEPAVGQDYFRRAEQEIARVPGVVGTAWIGTLPGGRPFTLSVRLEQPRVATRQVLMPAMTPPGPKLLGLTLKGGRPFSGADGPLSCRVALVNEAAAAEYFEGNAVGRSVEDAAGRRVDIVGLVESPAPKRGRTRDPLIYFYERQASTTPSPEARLERFSFPARPQAPPVAAEIEANVASSGYFGAIGATFESGRAFDAGALSGGCDVAVINREAAQLYFGGHAVGGAVIDPEGRRVEIIGVVDAGVLRVMQRRAAPMVYLPVTQRYSPRMTLIAGTRSVSPALLATMTQRLNGVPGGLGTPVAITLEEHLSRTSLGPERIATALVAASAAIAIALGLLGAYGVMSDSVRQKKREIALRLALGAQGWTIVSGVLRGGVRIVAAGAATGLLASWVLVRIVLHANPGFRTPAPWMWVACPVVLLLIVSVASILPARWALAVDPLTISRDG